MIKNKNDFVEVSYKNTTTKEKHVLRSKYVVGCDGGKSFVRELFFSEMDDLGFEQKWAVLDVLLKRKKNKLPDRTIQYCSQLRPATYCRNVGIRRRWK